MIHKSSIIEAGAILGKNVSVGPFCIIGKNVKIGNNTKLLSNVVVNGETDIGQNVNVFPFTSIGSPPQDLKYKGENSSLFIGNDCIIREHVTINPGTQGGGLKTEIGDGCLLMVGTHIAHDCIIKNNVIFANNATLAGHVQISNNVIIGGLSAIHQFVRVGEGAIIGGMSGVTSDIIPYGSVVGNRAKLNGINLIGLKRKRIKKNQINAMRKLYKVLFEEKKMNFSERISNLNTEYYKFDLCKKIILFLQENNSRPICHP